MTPDQAEHAAKVLRWVAPIETHAGRRAAFEAAAFLDALAGTGADCRIEPDGTPAMLFQRDSVSHSLRMSKS